MTPSDEEKAWEYADNAIGRMWKAVPRDRSVKSIERIVRTEAFLAGCAYARADEREKIWMELNKKLNDCTVIDFIKEAEKIVEERKQNDP